MSESIDCREAIARLQDYLKQELTPELAEEIRAHLEHCRPCFEHARFERELPRDARGRGPALRLPDALRARIVALLRIEMERD